jgi:hypothetical protein
MDMTETVNNEYGVEYETIVIRKLRIFRVGKQWLVEYQRQPRIWAPWDYFWWYNDGQYVQYYDAIARIEDLKGDKQILIPRFMKVKTFEVDQ